MKEKGIGKKNKNSSEAVAVLAVIQIIAVILVALFMFIASGISPQYFERLEDSIAGIFAKNQDRGGYFTPTEEKEYSAAAVFYTEAASEEASFVFTAVTKDTSDDLYNSSEAVVPVCGSITSDYGYREHPVYGGESFHSGIDIAAPEGSPIYAVLDGRVVAAGVAPNAGNYIKIDHGNDTVTLYCHCRELYVKEGINVRKGDIIACVGQTGLATGPHLHFELHGREGIMNPDIILGDALNVD